MTHKRKDSTTPKDEQRTPPSLFRKLDDRFHFDIDVAATPDNALCKVFFCKSGFDALKGEWYGKSIGFKVSFCNPPYSHGSVEPFVIKAYEESLKGAIVVFLISSDVSTEYYDICMFAAEWIRIKSRIIFNNADGTPMKGAAKFGSMCIVFDYKRWLAQGCQTIVTEMDWR